MEAYTTTLGPPTYFITYLLFIFITYLLTDWLICPYNAFESHLKLFTELRACLSFL